MFRFEPRHRRRTGLLLPALFALAAAQPLTAQAQPASVSTTSAGPSYTDLVDLVEAADLVVRAEVRRQAALRPERAPGLAPGHARLYIEAETQALIAGTVPVGEQLRYLVDVPLDRRGRAPKLRKQQVILFAKPVAGRPGELLLVNPYAQLPATPEVEARLRPIIAATLAPDKPPVVTGIADVLSIPGNLAGESETQLFLRTANGDPASITVIRRPGQPPRWGVSWSELVDQSARAPAPETLEWQRLACGLPDTLPADANLARNPAAQRQAAEDYQLVRRELGACGRTRGVAAAQGGVPAG